MYWAIARLAFQRQLAYRTANLAGLATNLFWGMLRASVLLALFGTRTLVAGYSTQAAVTYTGLTQALIAPLALWGWWDLIRSIRTGDVASDLSRPWDFFGYWAAQDLGRALAQLLFRGLPLLALYALVYRIALPPTPGHWLALGVALFQSLLLSFAWRFIVSLSAFWVQDATGVGRAAWTLTTFLSGFIMPLAFYPPWLITLMSFTPFPAMINTVVEIYLGLVSGPALLGALAVQTVWLVALYGVARLLLAAGFKKLVIQGG
jgi:ABC-2 type transport system permease protein